MKLSSIVIVLVMLGAFVIPTLAHGAQLVAYYPFNGDAVDMSSGHDNDGTVYGALLTNDCNSVPQSAYYLDGVDDYISVPDSPSLRVQQTTVAAWVRVDALADVSGYDTIARKQYGIADASYELGVAVDTGLPDFSINRGSSNPVDGIVTSSTALVLGTWHHLAGTYDGSMLRIYVDGILAGSEPYSEGVWYNEEALSLGAEFNQSTHWVEGTIDEIAIYDGALAGSDIRLLAASCSAPVRAQGTGWGKLKAIFR